MPTPIRLAAVAASLVAFPLSAQRAPDTLVVGTYAYSTNDRVANIAPLARVLGERLGRPVRVASLPDPPALNDAIRAGRVDVAVTNTFGYLLLAAESSPAGVPVATFRIRAGARSNYGAGVFARRVDVRSLGDLRTRAATLSIALVAPGSTTGNLVPRLYLATQGLGDLEGSFRSVAYAGTHAGAVAALRAGTANVAALATEEFERSTVADTTLARSLVPLWTSDDITLGPVVVRAALPMTLRDTIARVVVGLERTAPEAFAAVRDGWVEARNADAMVPADDRAYDGVRRMFGDPATAAALIRRFAR